MWRFRGGGDSFHFGFCAKMKTVSSSVYQFATEKILKNMYLTASKMKNNNQNYYNIFLFRPKSLVLLISNISVLKSSDNTQTLFLAKRVDEAVLLALRWKQAYWESGEWILGRFTALSPASDWPDSRFEECAHGLNARTHARTLNTTSTSWTTSSTNMKQLF